jgi:hypothetical protein
MREPIAWDELIGALIEVCEQLLKRTATVPIEHVPVRIVDALFLKSVDTLRAYGFCTAQVCQFRPKP